MNLYGFSSEYINKQKKVFQMQKKHMLDLKKDKTSSELRI